ncbi:MAG: EVE domain-containing protein [Planctomycetota bacterium]|nr:EVE domain-containing protein [Planctomycetota bacterium]
MPAWLVKTEPSTYSFQDLQREKRTVWEGVANATALIHLRKIRKGDAVFVYHTGKEKRIVGLAQAASDAYADPKDKAGKLAVVDLAPGALAKTPVTLAALKGDPRFKDFGLVRMGRLSVMPVPAALEQALRKLAGL